MATNVNTTTQTADDHASESDDDTASESGGNDDDDSAESDDSDASSDSDNYSGSDDESDGDESTDTHTVSGDYGRLITRVLNGESLESDTDLVDYDERKLIRQPEFQKLDTEMRERVLTAIQKLLPSDKTKKRNGSVKPLTTSGKIYYVCNNCGYQTPLPPGTVIYEQNNTDSSMENLDPMLYRNMMDDPTLPRTRNYTCPNKKCPSHAKPQLREKVTIRPSTKKYFVVSICCACEHVWK